jgi:hypothetical protein
LTQVWSWRATFFFLAAMAATILPPFIFFKDTFRRERSLAYQTVVKRIQAKQAKKGMVPGSPIIRNDKQKATPIELTEVASRLEEARTPTTARDIKLTLADVNPFPQLIQVFKRKNNLVILFPSGLRLFYI